MKRGVLALVCVLVLFVVGCGEVKQSTPQSTPQVQDYRSGTEGLKMSFVKNMPPSELYDTEPMNVMIQLENKGTYTVTPSDGSVYLSGYDVGILSNVKGVTQGSPNEAHLPQLQGRGPYLSQGGIDAVQFTGGPAELSGLKVDKYEPTILATACYKYETIATAQVCIDPAPFSAASVAKVCTPGTVSLGSQGAPIAVQSVEVLPSPGVTRFKISIANVGGGEVFHQNSLPQCSPYAEKGLGFNDLDYVKVVEVSLSGKPIKASCKPLTENKVRLVGNQVTLFCESGSLNAKSPYLAPLTVQLQYGYRSSINTRVKFRSTQVGR